MDVFKKIPVAEIELVIKLAFQTLIVVVGIFGNTYSIYCTATRSHFPRATNILMISLSLALVLQACTATIDYANHLNNGNSYLWGYVGCDIWNTLNVYLPMMLALHCFFCLLDRFVLLTHPREHASIMGTWALTGVLIFSYILPILATVPPIFFQWYTTEEYIKWRTNKDDCKFKTNMKYALISPVFTFWLPVLLVGLVIMRLFQAMERQDSCASLVHEKPPKAVEGKKSWTGSEMRRQHRLAITLWSVYWNVTLFWIPQHVWQFIYKVTDADWPRATNFMAWVGYLPCLILPALYRYYNIYEL